MIRLKARSFYMDSLGFPNSFEAHPQNEAGANPLRGIFSSEDSCLVEKLSRFCFAVLLLCLTRLALV
jgi:hypothetical protein